MEGGGGVNYEIGLFSLFGVRGSFLYILGLFKVKIQNGNIFLGCKISNILGMPNIPDFFFLGGGCGWG